MGKSIKEAAKAIGVSRKTLSKIVNRKGGITPEMAFRLSIALGSSPESWMGHQITYDLCQIERRKNEIDASPLVA